MDKPKVKPARHVYAVTVAIGVEARDIAVVEVVFTDGTREVEGLECAGAMKVITAKTAEIPHREVRWNGQLIDGETEFGAGMGGWD